MLAAYSDANGRPTNLSITLNVEFVSRSGISLLKSPHKMVHWAFLHWGKKLIPFLHYDAYLCLLCIPLSFVSMPYGVFLAHSKAHGQ